MTTAIGYGVASATSPLAPLRFERRALRANDVAIAVAYCGVCHSDAHQAHNDWGSSLFPMVPGHEIVGHVTAVGSAVTQFKIGETVAVGCLVDSCMQCPACEDGEEQQCYTGASPTYNGKDRLTGEINHGGYSDHIVVRDHFVLKVPAKLDIRTAAPLLCAGITVWSPLRRWNVGKGSKVAVVGLGGLGHMAVKLAAALGAEVTMVTTSPSKGEDARKLGASHVLLSTDQAAMTAATSRFDFVLNTIPVAHNVNPYLMLLGRKGVMVIVGAIEPLPAIHAGLLMRNDRAVAGSGIGGIPETQELLDFCAEHNILPDCEMVDIKDINEAWDRMAHNDVKYRFVIDMNTLKNVTV
ncbi:MAG: NAD(P)-dependent alcohol dehydrogenase [Spongiibacteraceae bacterium]